MKAGERSEAIANLNVLHEKMNALYQAERRIWLTVQGKEPTVEQIDSLRQIEKEMRLLGKQQGELRRRLYEEENSPAVARSSGESSLSAYLWEKSRDAEREQGLLAASDPSTADVLAARARRFRSAVVRGLAVPAMVQGLVMWLRRSVRRLQSRFRGKKLRTPRPCAQSVGEEERLAQPDLSLLADGARSVSATSPTPPPVQERVSPPAMSRRDYEEKRRQCANMLAQIQRIEAERDAYLKQMLEQGNAPNDKERAVLENFREKRLRLAQAHDALWDELLRADGSRNGCNAFCGGSRSPASPPTDDPLAADPWCA